MPSSLVDRRPERHGRKRLDAKGRKLFVVANLERDSYPTVERHDFNHVGFEACPSIIFLFQAEGLGSFGPPRWSSELIRSPIRLSDLPVAPGRIIPLLERALTANSRLRGPRKAFLVRLKISKKLSTVLTDAPLAQKLLANAQLSHTAHRAPAAHAVPNNVS
ncbi:hypothetical protein EVAR_53580_1 [Eumeta japonica]|uniref:Uncharacterized protein n=1 Tax=Eumeta variegata TaxID=151549 RepID=A0A4C1YLM1_EUMVA|nr:hypothetical protein EVAR_53580_1 [Eumeta japonica]